MEKKEYIERGAAVQLLRECTQMQGKEIEKECDTPILRNVLNVYYLAREGATTLLEDIPAADVVEVVHGDAEREYVESLLKRHAAYLIAKIDNTGTHVGKFEGITLDADGNWIIEADVESLSVTDCGDFAPVVHGDWIHNPKREYDYICSVCRGDAPENRMRNNAILTPYCPHCGSKMDGGKHETD